MGLLDGVRSAVSSVVNKVEQKVEATVEKVETKAADLGHSAVNAYEGAKAKVETLTGGDAGAPVKSDQPTFRGADVRAGLVSDVWNKVFGGGKKEEPVKAQTGIADAAKKAAEAAQKKADEALAKAEQEKRDAPVGRSPTGAPYDNVNGVSKRKVGDDVRLGNDNEKILENFTQANGMEGRENQRCGPTAVIASAIQKGGPREAAKLADAYARDEPDPDVKQLLQQASQRMKNGTATYGDLGTLSQVMLQRKYTGNPTTMDSSHVDMQEFMRRSGNTPPAKTGDAAHSFNDVFPPGSKGTWAAKVSISPDNVGNHWVTIGRDKDGKAFVYDPSGRPGGQKVYEGTPEFAKYNEAIFSGKQGTGILPAP
ncbi:MAG: hypothetical protein QM817_08065 [Archangium sp.]